MPTISELLQRASELQLSGHLSEAAAVYEQILRSEPRHAPSWHQLGLIALVAGQLESAREYFRRAIISDGSQAAFHHNMGTCCAALSQMGDAQASYEQALRIDPNYPGTRAHLCFTLFARRRRAETERLLVETLARARTTAEDRCAIATLLVSSGRFAEGWEEHEWRQQLPTYHEPRATPERKWDRSSLAGRSILVYSEQGLGDILQLVRYIPLLKEQGGRPILAVPRSLIPLLSEANLCPLVSRDEVWPRCDFELGMWSLPWAFRTTVETVPNNVPYLQARPVLVEQWRERLLAYPGFRIGISWHGNPAYTGNRIRSFPLAEFAPLAQEKGVRLISLQKQIGSQELAGLKNRFEVIDLGPDLDASGAFMDTAAVMKNLDLVISCDTATAHLAGALGVPVWLAQAAMPDWRWMRERENTPWYPTMRLFRQTKLGNWAEVFQRMAAEVGIRGSGLGIG